MDKKLIEEAANKNTSGDRLQELAAMDTNLAAIVAQNPNAPPQVLAQLYYNFHPDIRKTLAQNPNTPIHILWNLALEFPEDFLSNPILEILFLENPNFVKDIPIETLVTLLKYEQIPSFLFDFASKQNNRKIALSMLMNPKTSLYYLVNLFEIFDEPSHSYYQHSWRENEYYDAWDILLNIDFHVNWEQELKHGWQEEVLKYIISTRYTDTSYKQFLTKIFKSEIDILFQNTVKDSPEDLTYKNVYRVVLEKFFRFPEQGKKRKILAIEEKLSLARTTTDINTLTQLLTEEDKHFKIKTAMLENPYLPEEILSKILDNLIKRRDCINLITSYPEREVFKRAKIPSQFLEKMAQKKNDEWQLFVATHPNTPIYILEKLAQSSNKGIVANVAKNPSTPKNILSKLANDDWEIECSVAKNPNAPEKILRDLAQQNSYFVNLSLVGNPNLPTSVFDMLAENSSNDFSLARNPSTPTELLKKIALRGNNDHCTLILLVQHRNVNVEILEILAKSTDSEVRLNVAREATTPLHILERLAEDSDDKVRYAILMNPNLTKEDFLRLIDKIYHKESYSLGYLLALLDTNVSPSFLQKNAESLVWIERYIIALHPQTPRKTLQHLAKDANRYIRAAALERCQTF